MSNFQVSNNLELNGNIVFEGSSTDANQTTLSATNPTGSRTVTIPDAITWTTQNASLGTTAWKSVVYGNNLWVAGVYGSSATTNASLGRASV